MAYKYDLTKDFGFAEDISGQSTASISSGWVIAIFPYSNQITANKQKLFQSQEGLTDVSITADIQYALAEDFTLVLTHECTSISINTQKGSHNSGLQATLSPSQDFLRTIHPGDWIMAWMVQSQQDLQTLKQILVGNQVRTGGFSRANGFGSGLKFVGKVSNVTQSVNIDQRGFKNIAYSLSAYQFTEMDHEILYFLAIELSTNTYAEWSSKLGVAYDSIIRSGQGVANLGDLFVAFLKAMLGNSKPTGLPNPDGAIEGLDTTPQKPYCISYNVYKLLTGQGSSGSNYSYLDILNSFIGIQNYTTYGSGTSQFVPQVLGPLAQDKPQLYQTPISIDGKYPPIPPVADYKPLWNMLGEFLNEGLNEMYVTLRVGDFKGNIYPTFVARQKPFTSNEFDSIIKDPDNTNSIDSTISSFPYTKYMDLPRWIIDDEIIITYSISTDDSMRHNIIDVVGVAPAFQTPLNDAGDRYLRSGPKADSLDIVRNGLRSYSKNLNTDPNDIFKNNTQWVAFNADFLMNQQLQLTGSFTLHGIQSPICIGDNLQYKDVVYHIESVTHNCSIDTRGNKYFTTTVSVTHGLTADPDTNPDVNDPIFGQYPTLEDGIEIGNTPAINTINES